MSLKWCDYIYRLVLTSYQENVFWENPQAKFNNDKLTVISMDKLTITDVQFDYLIEYNIGKPPLVTLLNKKEV